MTPASASSTSRRGRIDARANRVRVWRFIVRFELLTGLTFVLANGAVSITASILGGSLRLALAPLAIVLLIGAVTFFALSVRDRVHLDRAERENRSTP